MLYIGGPDNPEGFLEGSHASRIENRLRGHPLARGDTRLRGHANGEDDGRFRHGLSASGDRGCEPDRRRDRLRRGSREPDDHAHHAPAHDREERLRLYTDALYRIEALIPPLREQALIVRFLDYADQQVRKYIRAKQKLVK